MKNNLNTAVQVIAQQIQVIPQVLLDCIEQLRVIQSKMENYRLEATVIDDIIFNDYSDFENNLSDAAYNLSQIMRVELLNNTFYAEPTKESEVTNA